MFDYEAMREAIEASAAKRAERSAPLAYEEAVRVVLALPFTESAQHFVERLHARGYGIQRTNQDEGS